MKSVFLLEWILQTAYCQEVSLIGLMSGQEIKDEEQIGFPSLFLNDLENFTYPAVFISFFTAGYLTGNL